jgi:lipoprotein signal peptidase
MFWTIAVVGLALDLATKYAAFAWLAPGEKYEIISGIFSFVHQERLNHGALFGFLNNPNDPDQARTANLIFSGVSCLAALLITAWSFKGSLEKDRWLTVALGLILSGALGNLYDRLVFGGVRDFIWFYYQPHFPVGWPVFNLADSWLVCGAGILLVEGLFWSKPQDATAKELPETAAAAQDLVAGPGK